jgi:hypothetical protein
VLGLDSLTFRITCTITQNQPYSDVIVRVVGRRIEVYPNATALRLATSVHQCWVTPMEELLDHMQLTVRSVPLVEVPPPGDER